MLDLHSPREWLRWIARNSKRLFVLIAGVAILIAGVAMLVAPGPGVLVILVGLAVLATEFAWAERALDRTTATAGGAAVKVSNNTNGRIALVLSGAAMVVGGIVVAIVWETFRVVAISIAVAGVIALLTLLPSVQRWIAAKTDESTARLAASRAD